MTKHLTFFALCGALSFSCVEQVVTENTADTCTDKIDNDGDGSVDCSDLGCAFSPNCDGTLENCLGGADEDLDGDADCADSACIDGVAGNALNENACAPAEDCNNGLDDDGDTFADCDDFDCDSDPSCDLTEDCDNSIDDDGDGDIDCNDPDCAANAACAPGDCAGLPGVIVAPSQQDVLEDTSVGSDVTAGTNTGIVQKCELGVGGGKELAYLFTPPTAGTLSLTLTSDTDQGIYVRTACGDPNSEIACADEFIAVDETISVAVSGGAPLFIFVDAFQDGTEGLFILTTILQ